MNKYIGNELQLYGVEEMRRVGGKGDGMRILNVRNAAGLEFVVSLDRGGDITRLSAEGVNYGYMSACGYVSPKYYDKDGGFPYAFTAGFFTTCGMTAVGPDCVDDGEKVAQHGTLSYTPCDNVMHYIEDDEIHIKLTFYDAGLFAYKLVLEREYICPLYENVIYLKDRIRNVGSKTSPLEILYHCNMGYPLLSENARVSIPSEGITPSNEHSKSGIDDCLKMEKPQRDYTEMVYFHKVSGKPCVSIENLDIGKGLNIKFDTKELKYFTQWKMMGEVDYVLGLEPGNCVPKSRAEVREAGMLEFLEPGDTREFNLCFEFTKM